MNNFNPTLDALNVALEYFNDDNNYLENQNLLNDRQQQQLSKALACIYDAIDAVNSVNKQITNGG